jgi:hypothetical protein
MRNEDVLWSATGQRLEAFELYGRLGTTRGTVAMTASESKPLWKRWPDDHTTPLPKVTPGIGYR